MGFVNNARCASQRSVIQPKNTAQATYVNRHEKMYGVAPKCRMTLIIKTTKKWPISDGAHWLSTEKPNLAKRDAFLVKISFVSNGYMNFSNLANSPPYSQSD